MLTKNQVKYIQSLGQKKLRDNDNCFIAEGPKLVNELLQAENCNVKELYALPSWIEANEAVNVKLVKINEQELNKISQLTTPNLVLATVEKISWPGKVDIKGKISLALDGIQDPGNMGTIIRLADWFGIETVFCSPDCVDLYNPKVVQSTMGSITRVRIVSTELASFFLNNKDSRIYATVLYGRDITKMDKINEGIIVIGNESKGVSDEVLTMANVQITVPGKGKAESLNAAVATGIILSHLV
jgi:RNA methyltransferase, TrmH family